ncbi:MAG: carbohydrate ABC transporter permease [Bacilli bacterium]|nr:carbohydrate ABC transporter permease [Bacilli bacterium]
MEKAEVNKVLPEQMTATVEPKAAETNQGPTEKQKRDRRDKIKGIFGAIAANLVLAFFSILVLFPLVFMVISSFRDNMDYLGKVIDLFPKKLTFDNYQLISTYVNLGRGYLNTMVIEIAVIPCGTFFAALAAFAFAKLKLRHKSFWLLFLLSGMMIPGAVLLMPRYLAYQILGWINTPLPLIVPHLFIHVSMMFFFIQYMMGIPSELFEAAKIDGCSTFRMFLQIMLPLLLPAIAAQCIFWFMGIWNEYFAASIYLSGDNATLQVMMASLNQTAGGSGLFPVVFSGAVLSCLPMVAIYLVLQKFFIKSMSIGAVKG